MRLIPAILILFVVVMSEAALDALGQIVQARVIQGTMDLQDGGRAKIEATGYRNGMMVKIQCWWSGGRPTWIEIEPMGSGT